MAKFSSLGLDPQLLETLKSEGYKTVYPIQEKAIPSILDQRDVLGIAKTGSGKTAGYVLPILTQLQSPRFFKNRHVDVLVLVPTRELAVQVGDVFQTFSQSLSKKVKTLSVFGGVSINPQMIAMQGVHVLVATPGRLLELVESKAVYLSNISTLVLDEADKMLNLGFEKEMNSIFKLLPARRQNLLFSATLNEEVESMNRVLLFNPLIINVDVEEDQIELIQQTAYAVEDAQKGPLLRHLIEEQDMQQVLIFASSVHRVNHIAEKLNKNGIQASVIHSKKGQGARTQALSLFKSGKLRVLVATDLLSRGIDIEFLPFVINYELPRSPKDYIHRIGRTGRAENPGQAISFISMEERPHFKVIQKKMKKWVNLTYLDNLDL